MHVGAVALTQDFAELAMGWLGFVQRGGTHLGERSWPYRELWTCVALGQLRRLGGRCLQLRRVVLTGVSGVDGRIGDSAAKRQKEGNNGSGTVSTADGLISMLVFGHRAGLS